MLLSINFVAKHKFVLSDDVCMFSVGHSDVVLTPFVPALNFSLVLQLLSVAPVAFTTGTLRGPFGHTINPWKISFCQLQGLSVFRNNLHSWGSDLASVTRPVVPPRSLLSRVVMFTRSCYDHYLYV
jgi:hypothetical protein